MNEPKLNYPVIGSIYSEKLHREVPILDIPMMSDERWDELARQQKAKHKGVMM